ncbi:MAG: hypothetical protein ACUVWV_07200 [Thermodesulfobacteriota bacterium]
MGKKGIVIGMIVIFIGGLNIFTPQIITATPQEAFSAPSKMEKVYPFITTQDLPFWGEIVGSQEGAVNLTLGDIVYIKLAPQKSVKPGDHFFIGRYLDVVIHPQTKKDMGRVLSIPGELVVLGGEGDIIIAKIHKSSRPIHEGDKIYSPPLLPAEETSIRINKKIKGQVISSLDKSENIMLKEFIFIDRGNKDGLIVGNTLKIYRSGQLLDKIGADKGTLVPKYKIGEAVVISVQKESSTAIITNSSHEINPGDEVISEIE